MNEHNVELNPVLDDSSYTELLVSQTDSALRRKVRYRPPLATIEEYGCTNTTEKKNDVHFMSQINLIPNEFIVNDTTVFSEGKIETLYYSTNWKTDEMETHHDACNHYTYSQTQNECNLKKSSSIDIHKLLKSINSEISVHSKSSMNLESEPKLPDPDTTNKESESTKNLLKDLGEFQTYSKISEDVASLEISKSSKSLLKYACLKSQNEKQNKEICSGDKEMRKPVVVDINQNTQTEIIGSGDITHYIDNRTNTVQLKSKPSLICVRNTDNYLNNDILEKESDSITFMKMPITNLSSDSVKESITDSSRCDLTIDLTAVQHGKKLANMRIDNIKEKQTCVRKRIVRTSSADDCSVHSSSVSMSSRESLILRNKYQFTTDYCPYYHNSVRQGLKNQLNEVPIYSPNRQNPITTEMIHTVTNTLYDLKTISQLPIISKDVCHELGLDIEELSAIQGSTFFDNPPAESYRKNENNKKMVKHKEEETDTTVSEDCSATRPSRPSSASSNRSSKTVDNKKENEPIFIEANTKQKFLEDLKKSIVDSETYFQRCLIELNKCAAKVVSHKEVLKPPIDLLRKKNIADPKLICTPQKQVTHQNYVISNPICSGKIKEIEQTMKDIDANQMQPETKNVNRKYREDVSSLIEKLKFLASYRKKVSIRPSRKRKLGKEKIELLEKSKKREDLLGSNDFETVVTQVEYDTGQSNKSNTDSQIQSSVQKVVEWKTQSEMPNAKLDIGGAMDVLKPARKSYDLHKANSTTDTSTPKTKDKVKFNFSSQESESPPNKGKIKRKEHKSCKINAVIHNTSRNTIQAVKSKSSSNKSIPSSCDCKGGTSLCTNKKCNLKVKTDSRKEELPKPDKRNILVAKRDVRYKKAIEKVIKYSEKPHEIPATNVIDQSTLNMLRDECLKLKQMSRKPGRDYPTIRVTDATIAQSLDEETRLLSEITPAAVAPFAAEYPKQKHTKNHYEQPSKDSNKYRSSTESKSGPGDMVKGEHMKSKESLSMAEVQILQNLITDPNAKFKSTMTIMPVTVNRINFKRQFAKREVAEKPFEHQSQSPRKVDFSTIKTAVKSPIRAYIMGTRPTTTLTGSMIARSTAYKDMLQAPEEKLRSKIPKAIMDSDKRAITVKNQIQATVATLVDSLPTLRSFSPSKKLSNFEAVHIPEKPLERATGLKQLNISKKNDQINEIIDDILSLSRTEETLYCRPHSPRLGVFNKQPAKISDYKEYIYNASERSESNSLELIRIDKKSDISTGIQNMSVIRKSGSLRLIKQTEIDMTSSKQNIHFSDNSAKNELSQFSSGSRNESRVTLKLRKSRKINRGVMNLPIYRADAPELSGFKDESMSKQTEIKSSKSSDYIDREKIKLRQLSSSGSEGNLVDRPLQKHKKNRKHRTVEIRELPTQNVNTIQENIDPESILNKDSKARSLTTQKLSRIRKPSISPDITTLDLNSTTTASLPTSKNRLADLAKPKSHYVRAHCEEFKNRLGQQFTDRMNRIILNDDKNLYPMLKKNTMSNLFGTHQTTMFENVLSALEDVIDSTHAEIAKKSKSKTSVEIQPANLQIPSIMEEDEYADNYKHDKVQVMKHNITYRHSNINIKYTKTTPIKKLQTGLTGASTETPKLIENIPNTMISSKEDEIIPIETLNTKLLTNERLKITDNDCNSKLYFKALDTLKKLGNRSTVRPHKDTVKSCQTFKTSTKHIRVADASKELVKLEENDVEIIRQKTDSSIGPIPSLGLTDARKKLKQLSQICMPQSTNTHKLATQRVPLIKVENLNTLKVSSGKSSAVCCKADSTNTKQETLSSVAFVMESILNRVFETITNNWKRRQNADDNFRSILYQKCSSSTLFQKLEEILYQETESNERFSNSDTTISSLLLPYDKNFEDEVPKRTCLVFGVKHLAYYCPVQQTGQLEHLISYYEPVELHASHLKYVSYVMESCLSDYLGDDNSSSSSSASDLWDGCDINWSSSDVFQDPLTLSGLCASRESVSAYHVQPLIPTEIDVGNNTLSHKCTSSEMVSYRKQHSTPSIHSSDLSLTLDEDIIINKNSDAVMEFLEILSNISLVQEYCYLSQMYLRFEVIEPHVTFLPVEHGIIVIWEKVSEIEARCFNSPTDTTLIGCGDSQSQHSSRCSVSLIDYLSPSRTQSLNIRQMNETTVTEIKFCPSAASVESNDSYYSVKTTFSTSIFENTIEMKQTPSCMGDAYNETFKVSQKEDTWKILKELIESHSVSDCTRFLSNEKISNISNYHMNDRKIPKKKIRKERALQSITFKPPVLSVGRTYQDFTLLTLYSLLFVCVFSCLTVQPVCQ